MFWFDPTWKANNQRFICHIAEITRWPPGTLILSNEVLNVVSYFVYVREKNVVSK